MESHTHTHTHTQTRVTQQSGEVNDYFCLSPHTHTHWREVGVFIDRLSSGWGSREATDSFTTSRRSYPLTARGRESSELLWGQGSEVRGLNLNQWWRQHTMTFNMGDVKSSDARNTSMQKQRSKKWFGKKKKIELQLFWSFFFSRFAVFLCMAVQFCDYISISFFFYKY